MPPNESQCPSAEELHDHLRDTMFVLTKSVKNGTIPATPELRALLDQSPMLLREWTLYVLFGESARNAARRDVLNELD
jgi:predicted ATPase